MAFPCPKPDNLQQFLLGLLPDADAERLQEHLAECPRCVDTLQGLEARDTLIDAMQAQSKPAPASEEAVVEDLVAHLSDLRPPAPQAAEATIDQLRSPPRKIEPADCKFLAPAQAADELGRLGGYRVLRILGDGDTGIVLEAEDPRLKRHVALKVMRPELATNDVARKRFLREAQAVAALNHDHIVAIHEVDEDRGLPFLAMPLLKGETLEDRLKRDNQLPLSETLRIGREIAAGLAAAHAAGLTHRDIKPANVWLENKDEGGRMKDESRHDSGSSFILPPSSFSSSFRVKIVDFGLARPAEDNLHLTASGTIAGTPSYMAPEQAEGKVVDFRCDLFSLGAVLYRMATGKLPFPGTSAISVLRALATEQPATPRSLNPKLPPELSELIMRLLAKEPKQRPASARAVVEALAKLEASQAPTARAAHPAPKRRHPALLVAAALLVIGMVTAAYVGPAATYRFVTNHGTLTINTHDEDVEVTVKQKGEQVEIVKKSTGEQVSLKAGPYELEISKGRKGLTLTTNQFTLTRGEERIVEVRFDPARPPKNEQPQPKPPPPPTPFVILARDGRAEAKHAGLAEAIQAARSGDIIEIRGNGPYDCPPLLLDKALVVRAGLGTQPVLQFGAAELGALGESLQTNSALTLEGLELRRSIPEEGPPGRKFFLFSSRARLHLSHCRLIVTGKTRIVALGAFESPACEVRNCLFAGQLQNSVSFSATKPGSLLIDNCVVASQHGVVFPDGSGSTIRLTRNTFVGWAPLSLFPLVVKEGEKHPAGDPQSVRIESAGNVIDSTAAMSLHVTDEHTTPPPDLVRAAVSWREQGNVYRPALQWLTVQMPDRSAEPMADIKDAKDWNQFWGMQGAVPSQGAMQFEGGKVRERNTATPETVAASDYRLHAKSAGKGAGENGRDLGADMDKVGPGKAYETWKKSVSHESWLAATGQSTPFVVLTRGVKTEQKFSNLPDAVTAAKNGDIVEIRGNGPFETPATNMGKALVIRAGAGFTPILQPDLTSVGLNAPLVYSWGPLVLEGLHFRHVEDLPRDKGYTLIQSWNAPLSVTHCRFFLMASRHINAFNIGRSPRTEVRHCEFAGNFTIAINWGGLASFHRLEVSDCLNWGGSHFVVSYHHPPEVARDISMRLERNTTLGHGALQHYYTKLDADATPEQRPFHVEARDNVFDTSVLCAMTVPATGTFQPDVDKPLVPRCFTWKESKNIYPANLLNFYHHAPPKSTNIVAIKEFNDWRGYWGLADTGSLQGRLRYEGENVRVRKTTAPEKLTAADFRLHRDSDGKALGASGRDLGVDVDKLGPGKAYEEWKKSPAYAPRWLDATGQVIDPEPIVILPRNSKKEFRFDTLAKAIDQTEPGDIIEIRGNGPFVTPSLSLRVPLVIRAGAGFEPVLQLDAKSLQASTPLLGTHSALTLEGLHFRHVEEVELKQPAYHLIHSNKAPLAVTHCRFFVKSKRNVSTLLSAQGERLHVSHCEFAGASNGAVSWHVPPTGELEATDNLCWGTNGFVYFAQHPPIEPRAIEVRLRRNTFVGNIAVLQHLRELPEPPTGPKPYRIDAAQNIFDGNTYMAVFTETGAFDPETLRPLVPRVVAWKESRNQYRDAGLLWLGQHAGKYFEAIKDAEAWQAYWSIKDTGCLHQPPRYQGGDLRTLKAFNPERFTPGEFRLHAESAGASNGCGAAVELVGPGSAYEYWKRIPEYQEWLKVTGQAR